MKTTTERLSFVARAALVLCGLVVLSLVGRFAVAGGQVSPAPVGGSAEVASFTPPPPVVATAIADASPPPIAHSPHATQDDPVYLNEATVDDLRRLPNIGEKRALAVLELRKKLGRFKQIEDLLRVKGIGRSTLRKLRPLVKIDHPEAGVP
jgi:competence protein ComEA